MGSTLNPDSEDQEITPTDEEYDGKFQSRRRDVWDDEEEEEEDY